MSRPLILVVNDDGITAPGIKALVNAVRTLGDVVVVAPDSPQSGMGHAITINKPLRVDKVNQFGDIPAYQCSGTPADCVKVAVDKILKENQIFVYRVSITALIRLSTSSTRAPCLRLWRQA